MGYVPETFDVILQRWVNRMVARTSLTDITQTSEMFQMCAAGSRGVEKTHDGMIDLLDETDIDKAEGTELDERAKIYNPDILTRLSALTATTSVQFSRTGIVGLVNIPIGTQVKSPSATSGSDLVFTTTAAGSIADGFSVSGLVAVTAAEAGSDYNVAVGAINTFVSKPSGIDAVTNPSAVTNGLDEETDDAFRKRIKDYLKALSKSTVHALESAARTVQDSASGKRVVFANCVEDENNPGDVSLYIDDGSGTAESTTTVAAGVILAAATGGEVDIYFSNRPIKSSATFNLYINAILVPTANYYIAYPHGHVKLDETAYPSGLTAGDAVTADYTYYTNLIAECQKVIDGDPADRSNYPGYRSAGILVEVLSPQIVNITVVADIDIRSGYTQATVITDVTNAISGYINTLEIGEDVIRNEMIERIMGVTGVYDVLLTTPSSNTIILDNQIARGSSSTITVT